MLYFLSHPIQYFSPLLRQLGAATDLEVYYYSGGQTNPIFDKGFGKAVAWDIPLLEGYNYRFLKNKRKNSSPNTGLWDVINPGIPAIVRKSPDKVIIVNGWSYSSDWLVAISARLFGKKLWIRAENPLNQELKKPRLTRTIKKIVLGKILFGLFTDKCLYIGKQSKAFFEYYGVPAQKLVYTPYAVDNDFFNGAYLRLRDNKMQLRQKFGIPPGTTAIVFTGKYIPKKRPMDLLKAVSRLDAGKYFLLMVGEGEMRGEMERFIRERGMNNVQLTGFVNQSTIPEYYTAGDVFVMCSGMGETWGLAVNEAMNFRLPVIVSDTCGCSGDLVEEGGNGYTFPEGDTDRLADRINDVAADEDNFRRMGLASHRIIQAWSIREIVKNIQEDNVGAV